MMSRWNIISANDTIHATPLLSNYYCMNDTNIRNNCFSYLSFIYKAHVKSCLENRLSMVLQKLQEKEDRTSYRCPSAFDHRGSTGNSSRGTPVLQSTMRASAIGIDIPNFDRSFSISRDTDTTTDVQFDAPTFDLGFSISVEVC